MPSPDPTVCILLARPDRARGVHLRAQLDSRGWTVHEATHLPLAMAELAVREKAQATRAAWGLQRVSGVACAVEEPSRWLHWNSFVSAMSKYFPDVAIWDCSNGELKPVREAASAVEEKKPARAASAGAVMVADEHQRPEQPSDDVDDSADATVSREELDMLLELTGDQHQ